MRRCTPTPHEVVIAQAGQGRIDVWCVVKQHVDADVRRLSACEPTGGKPHDKQWMFLVV